MSASQGPVPAGAVFSAVIPWVDTRHTEDFVRSTFEMSGWGSIMKVDWSLRRNNAGREFYVVYIHFGTFPNTEWRKFLDEGGELKVFFSPTSFWKVRASRWKPRAPAPVPVFIPRVEFPAGSMMNGGGVSSPTNVPSSPTYVPSSPTYLPPGVNVSVPPPPLPAHVEIQIENEMEEVLDAIANTPMCVATDEEIEAAQDEFMLANGLAAADMCN